MVCINWNSAPRPSYPAREERTLIHRQSSRSARPLEEILILITTPSLDLQRPEKEEEAIAKPAANLRPADTPLPVKEEEKIPNSACTHVHLTELVKFRAKLMTACGKF